MMLFPSRCRALFHEGWAWLLTACIALGSAGPVRAQEAAGTADNAAGKKPAEPPGLLWDAQRPQGHSGAAELFPVFQPRAMHYLALRAIPPAQAAIYQVTPPQAGTYALWLRYNATRPAYTRFAFNDPKAAQKVALPAVAAHAPGPIPAEFSWALLGNVDLAAGEQTLYLYGGPFLADALWLGPVGAVPPDEVPPVERPRIELPPLEHTAVIPAAEHPRWIYETVRVAYGHWEREKSMPLADYAARVKADGATAILALGNVPDIPTTMRPAGERSTEAAKDRVWKPDYSWVKDFADTVHAQGLRCTIYSYHAGNQDELLAEHPDWRELDEAGKPAVHNQPCFTSPYWDLFVQRMVGLARAGADGIVMDMLALGNPGLGDRNPYTLAAFKQRFGVEAPDYIDPADPLYQRWIEFQSYIREEALLRLTQAVHQVNPDFAVIVNQQYGWHFAPLAGYYLSPRLHECVDGLLEEIGWEIRLPSAVRRVYAAPLQVSFQNAFLRCRSGTGKGFMWYLTPPEPKVEYQARSLNMLAHGVVPNTLFGAPLEWRGKLLWDDIKPLEESVLGTEALPWLGLLYSERTLTWRYHAVDELVNTRPYVESVYGAFQAAIESRCPSDILSDEQLTLDNLQRYRVIVLPNAAALSPRQVEALRAYVRGGGGLVATYETSLCDATARQLPNFALADVLGVDWKASGSAVALGCNLTKSKHELVQDPAFTYMRAGAQGSDRFTPTLALTTGRPDFSVAYTVAAAAAPDVAAEGTLAVTRRITDAFTADQKEASPDGCPAFFTRTFGAGRVVYFPVDLTRAYFVNNSPATGALLARAYRWAAQQDPPVDIAGQQQIEATYFTKPGTLYVHLLNDASGWGRGAPLGVENINYRRDIVPVFNLPVQINVPATHVRLLPDGLELPLQKQDGKTSVTVPRVDLDSVLVITNQ